AFVTQETGVQKQLSIEKENVRVSFWSVFLTNKLHHYIKDSKGIMANGTVLLKSLILEMEMEMQLHRTSSVADMRKSLTNGFAKVRQKLDENEIQPFWVFNPTENDWL